jgi:uncharacterized protein with HEPN domain
MSQADFEISNLTYDATIHNLEVIGEAATQMTLKLYILISHGEWW